MFYVSIPCHALVGLNLVNVHDNGGEIIGADSGNVVFRFPTEENYFDTIGNGSELCFKCATFSLIGGELCGIRIVQVTGASVIVRINRINANRSFLQIIRHASQELAKRWQPRDAKQVDD
jgi:hypothetical protein